MDEPAPTGDLCIRCGYDLAGLADAGVCPECALPVAVSRERSPLLRGADRVWLESVASGLRGIDHAMWAILIVLVLGIVLGMAVTAVCAGMGWGSPSDWVFAVPWFAGLIAAAVLHGWGCWRLTRATPSEYSPPIRSRLVLRFCGLAFPIGAGALLFGRYLPGPISRSAAGILPIQAIGIAFALALGRVMEHLERRTPGWSPDLARKHRNFRKNIWAVAAILLLFDLGNRGRDVSGVTWALLGLMYMVMDSGVSRVRRAVQGELADARLADAMAASYPARP